MLSVFCLVFLLSSCNNSPSPQDVQEMVKDEVEELLTENNSEAIWFRMDRFFLMDNPEPLTYTGSLKCTVFYNRYYSGLDSLYQYRDVVIKFQSNKYDYYYIEIKSANQ